ncbi:cbb3-type cytochrome c oxidase subunit II [Gimesia algae]|uniref:Cytochrome C oxidase, mono-heme subunit/FixO n=1 Tax=Gimesia algae TaxID=2527971 RepID=A0A517VEX6_9PLAN|nr:cbb3-type cytochrome c oxidase subunit II [Gimesia algae]QDT91536.1 Cytochrome C oxidase, mono-heme subunit/FixO [Gimesia algae]
MNRVVVIILGILAVVIASLLGLVIVPNWQFEEMQPVEIVSADGSQTVYPVALDRWREAPGREMYRSLGCIYCHSQQVRPEGFGADFERGWGQRRSVPRDYVLQSPPYLGTMRTGPDLANIGARQPTEQWHLLHLYDPQITSIGSTMPPFKFLFEKHLGSEPTTSPGTLAIQLPNAYAGQPTWIIPKKEAMDLVAYLLTLHQKHDLEDVK